MNKQQVGCYGEQLTARKLEQDGFTVLAHNYKKQYGEIDLIALNGDLLVFVEVKMRRSCFFDLAEVITHSKQRKIITVAKEYIAKHNYNDKTCRFDVALIDWNETDPHITYLPDAFCDEG